MAEQGVRTAELIISDRAGEPSDLEMRLHKDTKAVLKADQEAYDKHENETQGKGKGDDQTECGAAERMEEEEERDKCEQRKMMSWSEAPTGRIEEDPSEMSGGFSSFDGPELPQVVESER
ncbi:unnamed protein product [Zymoseptoria tritici ST99CH_1A5]|uniref:Uncharacterized protein n=2 Tax=Zymoseptoria tritici TaxID=1047171 RepID=A0A1X7RVI4_ZYMT9|nr:unnamed protein product [Zymoseptoria tritici ST99CH_3D7]SMR54731.1 unnamed protein product [Zymoseptoria tritici ST99CH_3D1]SMY24847.1 unnamed protein product [Zymoseptoria tritici ST99CH_1A5]